MSQPEISKRCLKCGATIREYARFCPQCGQPFRAAARVEASAPTIPLPEPRGSTSAEQMNLPSAPRARDERPAPSAPASSELAPTGELAPPPENSSPPSIKQPARATPAANESSPAALKPTSTSGLFGTTGEEVEPTERQGRLRSKLTAVEAGVRPRAEKLRQTSSDILDEAADDPALRFVLIAIGMFLVFVLFFILSRILS